MVEMEKQHLLDQVWVVGPEVLILVVVEVELILLELLELAALV